MRERPGTGPVLAELADKRLAALVDYLRAFHRPARAGNVPKAIAAIGGSQKEEQ